jgi:hypothetical protein
VRPKYVLHHPTCTHDGGTLIDHLSSSSEPPHRLYLWVRQCREAVKGAGENRHPEGLTSDSTTNGRSQYAESSIAT